MSSQCLPTIKKSLFLLHPNRILGWATWVKSRKGCFKGSHDILNSFSASWPSQNSTWLTSRKRFSRARKALSTYFRPLDQPKMRLGWINESDFYGFCKALRTHFLPLDQPKMRFGWSRKRDVSSCQMPFWSHFLLLDQPKMRLFLIRKSDDSSDRMTLKSYFIHLDKPKIRLWWSRESDVSNGRQALGTHFLTLDQPKMRLGLTLFPNIWTLPLFQWYYCKSSYCNFILSSDRKT